MPKMKWVVCIGAVSVLVASTSTSAQQTPAPSPPGNSPSQPPSVPPAGVPATPPSNFWAGQARMQLERQYGGPLRDTLIQRWRDPADGTICYIYLPISVAHSNVNSAGFVEYGSSGIGSITCHPGAMPQSRPKPAVTNQPSLSPNSSAPK